MEIWGGIGRCREIVRVQLVLHLVRLGRTLTVRVRVRVEARVGIRARLRVG